MSDPIEFSRRILLDRIGPRPATHEIAATPAECAALAKRFDLISVDTLSATVTLVRTQAGRAVELTGRLRAAVVQACVVTLEPVPASVEDVFTVIYAPMGDIAPDDAIDSDPEGPAYEPLPPDAIDIGEAVAQQLALVIDPFPRLPDAQMPREGLDSAPDSASSSPFAALRRVNPAPRPRRS